MRSDRFIALALTACSWMYAIYPASFATPPTQREAQENEWTLSTSSGVPFWIALRSRIGVSPWERRLLFLYLEPHDFTSENLKKIFTYLALEFPKPDDLSIRVYSDRTILERAIHDHVHPEACCRIDSLDLEKMREKLKDEYNFSETIYYTATYYRTDDREEFSYNRDPHTQKSISVVLKSPPTHFIPKGDIDSDFVRAAREGASGYVESLLAKGAKVNSKDKNGYTALMHAAAYGRLEIIRMLLQKGADVNTTDDGGATALMRAALAGDIVIAKELLDKGADVNARDRTLGMTALMASTGHPEVAEVLLDAGAEIEAKDDIGHTALILSAARGDATAVKLLLSRGADVNARDKQGKTSLTQAKGNGRDDILQLLEQAGGKQ